MAVSMAQLEIISLSDDVTTTGTVKQGCVDSDEAKWVRDREENTVGGQVLEVKNVSFDVDEKGSEWWQKLTQFQMPWEWIGKKTQTKKRVLSDVCFKVKSGEMLAVLGGSGSGKTTLLDCTSGQATHGEMVGEVLINDKKTTTDMIKECTAYVRQNDRLIPHLTVKETLMFVAQLKLPKHWNQAKREARVTSVIQELGLKHVTHSKVGGVEVRGISGGERRRVSIGLQLLLDPGILFLDEPTSGLDSFTAHHLVETLKGLSRNDRIVMLSIHQPRSDIFELFDSVMLLSQGHVIYHGLASNMVHYFTQLNYPCPDFTNPCDFYVDLITMDFKNAESESRSNERLLHLIKKYNEFSSPGDKSNTYPDHQPNSKVAHSSPAKVDPLKEAETHKMATQAARQERQDEVKLQWSRNKFESVGASFQFAVLLKRNLVSHLEDVNFLGVQAVEAFCMSLMIGAVFYGLQLNQVSVRDRFGLLYVLAALYPYMVILDVIGQYFRDRAVFYFEISDGLYTHLPYFFAKICSEIPEHTIFTIIYSTPVYYMAGLQNDVTLFFTTFALLYLLVYCSRCLGLFSGALLPTYQLAVLFAQTMYTLLLLACGFIFNLDNIFVGVAWTSYVSYLKWGFQGMCINEFSGLNFTCEELPDEVPEATCINTGDEALEAYSLDGGAVWLSSVVVFAECLGWLALFFIAMRFISQKPHEP